MKLCRHCGKNTSSRAGGLCRRCHAIPELRRKYPDRRRFNKPPPPNSLERAEKRHKEPTQEEVDRMVAEGYANLPAWWHLGEGHESRHGSRHGSRTGGPDA